MMSSTFAPSSVEVRPLGAAIGADVDGLNLASLDDAAFETIEQAWAEHLVLRFRNQALSDIELMEFSRRFGQLDRVPIRAAGVLKEDDPRIAIAAEAREFVTIISNVKVDGFAIGGLGNYESHWHTDMSYNAIPPTASALYGIEVPPHGGNTSFSSMYAAYEALDEATRHHILTMTCIHDASRNSTGELRRGFEENTDPSKSVGARHPLVRVHPVTGRACLFLGRRRNAYIPELSLDESEALLDRLWTHASQARFCWTQEWRKGDLVIWDNRCAMHRRDSFDDSHRRVMHRTQICGTAPVGVPHAAH
jgi:taurine dioxygenase